MMVTLVRLERLRTPVPIWLLLTAILVTASVTTAIFVAPTYLSPKQDFSLQPVDATRSFFAGSCVVCYEFIVRVNSLNGFTGIVSFTTSAPTNLNVGLSGATNPNPLALLGRNDTLFVHVGTGNVGNYTLTVTGTSGVLSHSATLTVVAQSLTFTVNPDPVPIVNATSPIVTTNATVTISGVNGFSGNLSISASGSPESSARVYRSTVFLPFRGTASATINATVSMYIMYGYVISALPCRGPGYVSIMATSPGRGYVSHTFATVCV